ncbi:MAG: diaminopimelate decarboxylase [Candidatus Cybelea sp.]
MTAFPRWHSGLAEGQTRDGNGNLLLGGISADRLVQIYGTPLLAIDLAVVDAAIEQLLRCATGLKLEIAYAAKAFATVEFVRHLAARSIGLDVCSLGELVTAERAGFPAQRLTLHGAGKTEQELRAACGGRIGYIVVDGIEELEALARLSRDASCAQVILRLNVGIEAQTHAFVRTGGDDTKFGIPARDEPVAIAILRDNPQLRFAGLHAHLGSQIRQPAAYVENAAALLDSAERFERAGFRVERVVIGGGFRVETQPQEDGSLDVVATIGDVAAYVLQRVRERNLSVTRLGVEPGRAIVALAGTSLYRVLAVKRQSRRTFVVVDGGIAENPRPALYGARHHVIPAAAGRDSEEEMTLCGRSCENDELAIVRLPRSVCRGELLAMCATGAYTYSMAGNYNRFPRPAVVGIAEGTHRLLARRESLDDVLRRDAVGNASGEAGTAF